MKIWVKFAVIGEKTVRGASMPFYIAPPMRSAAPDNAGANMFSPVAAETAIHLARKVPA